MKTFKITAIYKDGSRLCVNDDMLAEYIEKGWSLDAPKASGKSDGPKDGEGADSKSDTDPSKGEGGNGEDNKSNSGDDNTTDYSQFTDEQLIDFAKQAGLPGTIKKRETIITKLTEMSFDPLKAE